MAKVEPKYMDSSVGIQLEQSVADGEALRGLGLTKGFGTFPIRLLPDGNGRPCLRSDNLNSLIVACSPPNRLREADTGMLLVLKRFLRFDLAFR
jgi:hypothetical protein